MLCAKYYLQSERSFETPCNSKNRVYYTRKHSKQWFYSIEKLFEGPFWSDFRYVEFIFYRCIKINLVYTAVAERI